MITKTAVLLGTGLGYAMSRQVRDVDNEVRNMPLIGKRINQVYGKPSDALKQKYGLKAKDRITEAGMKRGAMGEVIGGVTGIAGALLAKKFIKNPNTLANVQLGSLLGAPVAGASIGASRFTARGSAEAYNEHIKKVNKEADKAKALQAGGTV